jgi:hypothetical protein
MGAAGSLRRLADRQRTFVDVSTDFALVITFLPVLREEMAE